MSKPVQLRKTMSKSQKKSKVENIDESGKRLKNLKTEIHQKHFHKQNPKP